MKQDHGPSSREAWRALKEEIREAAPALGIDKIGFTTADPYTDLLEILRLHREQGRESGFEEPDLNKRVDPGLSLQEPQSIISIAVAYPSKLSEPPPSEPGAHRGILSRSAWGQDYHHVLRDRLDKLGAFIRERVPEARTISMVDTGALVDRAVAQRAGIGWIGKNCSVITPEFGSWVYLGEMITDIPFPPDEPVSEDCGACTLCIDACPAGAIVGPGQLNAKHCLSYLTQTKEIIPEPFRAKIGNRLYGCDTCQMVCPKNKDKHWTHHPELQPDPERAKPLLHTILQMSNKTFKATFGTSAAAWRGKRPVQRNAVLALGSFKDRSVLPILIDILNKDQSPELRASAAWSIGRIGGEEAAGALAKALQTEADENVRTEAEKALAIITGTPPDGAQNESKDSGEGNGT